MGKLKLPKKEKVKDPTPKQINHRKYIRFFVFTLALFVVLGSFRAFTLAAKVNSGDNQKQTVQQDDKGENLAISAGAQTFAIDFTRHYLRWDKENPDERAERLEQFLRVGVDKQAGFIFGDLKGNSKPDKVTIINTKETGENTGIITVEATHLIDQKAEGSDTVKTVGSTKYINVPIITDGKGYLVNGLPSFTAPPKKPKMGAMKSTMNSLTTDVKTPEIQKSLKTFLKVYATGTNEELSYYTNDKSIRVLNSSIEFQNIENVVSEKAEKGKYNVIVDAVFKDTKTNGSFQQRYELVMIEKDNRWLVETIKQ